METIELFSGTKSFSKIAAAIGHTTLTFDIDPALDPDHLIDILDGTITRLVPLNADVLWASPPCQAFSVAAIGHNWTGGFRSYVPKTDGARRGQAMVLKTLEIIEKRRPTWWFIENPRGMLRKMPFMEGLTRHTVTYCQYGDTRMKPTDIWTNAYWWKPRPACHNGDQCHEAAPRGAKTGTQGIQGARDRGRIPAALFEEMFEQMPIELKEAA